MASIYKTFVIEAPADRVWDALRDVGAIHERLVPQLVVATKLDGDVRTVTFAHGLVVRERLVDIDEQRRRVAYAAAGGALSYHHASMQVFDEPNGHCRFVWETDLQPQEMRESIAALVDQGSQIMRRHLASIS